MGSILRDYMSRSDHTRAIVGDTKTSFTDFDHLGWLKCDGRMLSVADYMSLYKVIGYAFGGSGSQFKLPDMRGRVAGAAGEGLVRDDANRLLSIRTKGQYSGEEVHQLSIAELASHNHGVAPGGQGPNNNRTSETGQHNHGGVTGTASHAGAQGVAATSGGNDVAEDQGTHAHTISPDGNHYHVLNGAGNDVPHNNMQPTLFLGNMFIYCDKVYEGAGHLATGTDII
jgi:microcystin-dependent protein